MEIDGHIIKLSLGESDHKKDLPGVIGVWVPEVAFAVRGITFTTWRANTDVLDVLKSASFCVLGIIRR